MRAEKNLGETTYSTINNKKQLSKSRTQYMFFPTHQSSVASKNESNLSGSMSSMYLTFANTFSI